MPLHFFNQKKRRQETEEFPVVKTLKDYQDSNQDYTGNFMSRLESFFRRLLGRIGCF